MKNVVLVGLCALGLAACSEANVKTDASPKAATTPATSSQVVKVAKEATEISASELYEVHHDGRIHVFYDFDLYQDFLAMGETPYRVTRIGAGPKGETMVFGLLGKDKKKSSGIPGIELIDGTIKPEGAFYGELVRDGRIYVVDDYDEFMAVHSTGEAAYRFTQIGSGPNGETVVYVLTKEKKKQRPDAMMVKFKQVRM